MRTPTPLTVDDPTRAGRFHLLGRLASGGMGVVYLARRDDRPDSLVALKMMRPELRDEPVFRQRFTAEIEASQRLAERGAEGTHVARAVDADVSGDLLWLATEFVPGPSVAEEVELRSLDDREVEQVARDLAAALVALHDEGLVHGDIKPTNVVLGPDGLRLVDLGLAREHSEESDAVRLGSPGWSPPEMAEGMVSPAADVHGWGMTVAFCATRRPPFGIGTAVEVHERMRQKAPDLDGVALPLLPLVSAALRPDPAERPDSATLLAALEEASSSAPIIDAAPTTGETAVAGGTAPLIAPTLLESLATDEPPAGRSWVLPGLAVAAVTIGLLVLAALFVGLLGNGDVASSSAVPAPSSSTTPAVATTAAARATTAPSASAAPTRAAPKAAVPVPKGKGHGKKGKGR